MPGYGQHVLDWLGVERPDLARRVQVHETGSGRVELDGVCAVLFWLGDPLERYPDCLEEALVIQREAERASVRVINPPTALATYGKELQATLFSGACVPSPPAVRLNGPEDLEACGERWGFPLIVRGDQSYGQAGTRVVRSAREIRSLQPPDLPLRPVASPLIDVRERRAGHRNGDLWSRLYHRKRAFLIGEECVSYSLFFGTSPVVAQDTSLYQDYHVWQRRLRPLGRAGRRVLGVLRAALGVNRALALEGEYRDAPVAHAEVLRRAGEALGLRFLAFDYASLPDGEIVIWEANPYPYLPPPRKCFLPHTRQSVARSRGFYEAFARCLETLANGGGCASGPGGTNSGRYDPDDEEHRTGMTE